MIRVLHSVSNMDRAGIETMIMNYYRNIDRTKVQFDFLCNKPQKGAYDDEISNLGGNIYVSPGFNPLKYFKYKKFVKKIVEDNPDIKIIHAHNGSLAYFALRCAKAIKFPNRIAHAHATMIPHSSNSKLDIKWLYKNLFKNRIKYQANYFLGCSTEACKFYFGDKKDFTIINNAIDEHKFIFNEDVRKIKRKELKIDEDTILIGHVGRFMLQKNHDFLVDIYEKIHQKNQNTKLLLIGDGELKEKIREKIKEKGLEESTIFLENINNVNEYYQAMDIFILPSLYEGLPVVGIEAQAAGLKCFFTNTISPEVKITDNVTFLGLDDSPAKWADEVLKYKDGYERKDMTKQVIEAGYSIKEEAKKLQELYEKIGAND